MQTIQRAEYKAKRAAYKDRMVQSSRVAAQRNQDRTQAEERSYGNAVRDISRDASRRGLTSNTPLKVNAGGYVISTAPQTQPLTREQLIREYY